MSASAPAHRGRALLSPSAHVLNTSLHSTHGVFSSSHERTNPMELPAPTHPNLPVRGSPHAKSKLRPRPRFHAAEIQRNWRAVQLPKYPPWRPPSAPSTVPRHEHEHERERTSEHARTSAHAPSARAGFARSFCARPSILRTASSALHTNARIRWNTQCLRTPTCLCAALRTPYPSASYAHGYGGPFAQKLIAHT